MKTAVREALHIYVHELKSRTIPLFETRAERDAWILAGSDDNKHKKPIKPKARRVHQDRDQGLKLGLHLGTAEDVPEISPELLAPIIRTSTKAELDAWLVSAEKAELDAWILDGTVPARVMMTNRTAARSGYHARAA